MKLLDKNGAGVVQKTSNFVWSSMTIAEERDNSNAVLKRFLPEGVQLPTGASPNNKLYYSKDHLGSVRSLTNANGTILGTLDYDAYGGISRVPVPANDTSGLGPVLTSAVSRVTHGSAGTFDVNLPLTGAPGIEMRAGTSYTLILTFDRTVLSATSVTVASGVGSVANTTFSGSTATVSPSGISDDQTITVELDNVVGVVGFNTKVLVSMSVLTGDVNQSGAVTVEDIALVQANTGVAVTGSTFKYDTTHNGAINSSDIAQAKSLNGNSFYPDFAFTGHFYHARSGLYLAPYRAYNPTIGRWLSRDALDNAELKEGPNLYLYVNNNPANRIDRQGRSAAAVVLAYEVAIHWVAFTEGLKRYPDDDDMRHCWTSCVITKLNLGLPITLLSGSLFEGAQWFLNGGQNSDWRDDIRQNVLGIAAAQRIFTACDESCKRCQNGTF